jgi:uncharacterized protein YggE
MKKIWLIIAGVVAVLGILVLSGCGTSAGPNDVKVSLNSQQQGIWVSAVGKVTIVPNLAVLSLGIESQEISVADAQSKASEAMDKVMQSLKAQGIDEKDIQTQYFNISQMTRWDNYNEKSTITGYRVTNTVTVKVRKVEKAGEIIDAVVVAGGDLTRINSINFTVEEPSPYYKDARDQAIKYAKEKAQQMADGAGVKLGEVTYITENSNTYYQPYSNYMMADSAVPAPVITMPPAPISVGQLEISTTVQIAYAVEK